MKTDRMTALPPATGHAGREAGPISAPLMLGEVAKRLRSMIASGELEPGRPIRERTLGRALGVSRTPLREAFRMLAGEGLIDILPRLGARVARLKSEDVDHIFSVMEALEGLAGELACKHMSPADFAELLTIHRHMLSSYRSRHRDAFFVWNQRLHERIIAAAGNPVLSRLYAGLDGQMRRARYMALNTPSQWREAIREHEAIMAALKSRDGQEATTLLRAHLRNKQEKVKSSLAAGEKASAGLKEPRPVRGTSKSTRPTSRPDSPRHPKRHPRRAPR